MHTWTPHSIAGSVYDGAYGSLWQAGLDLTLTLRTTVVLVPRARNDDFLFGDMYGWLFGLMCIHDAFVIG